MLLVNFYSSTAYLNHVSKNDKYFTGIKNILDMLDVNQRKYFTMHKHKVEAFEEVKKLSIEFAPYNKMVGITIENLMDLFKDTLKECKKEDLIRNKVETKKNLIYAILPKNLIADDYVLADEIVQSNIVSLRDKLMANVNQDGKLTFRRGEELQEAIGLLNDVISRPFTTPTLYYTELAENKKYSPKDVLISYKNNPLLEYLFWVSLLHSQDELIFSATSLDYSNNISPEVLKLLKDKDGKDSLLSELVKETIECLERIDKDLESPEVINIYNKADFHVLGNQVDDFNKIAFYLLYHSMNAKQKKRLGKYIPFDCNNPIHGSAEADEEKIDKQLFGYFKYVKNDFKRKPVGYKVNTLTGSFISLLATNLDAREFITILLQNFPEDKKHLINEMIKKGDACLGLFYLLREKSPSFCCLNHSTIYSLPKIGERTSEDGFALSNSNLVTNLGMFSFVLLGAIIANRNHKRSKRNEET